MDMELCTPNFDKLLSDATGGDEASIRMIEYALGMLLLPNKMQEICGCWECFKFWKVGIIWTISG